MFRELFKQRPLVCMITEGRLSAGNFREQRKSVIAAVRNAAEAGIQLIQIREKFLPAADLFCFASEAVTATREFGTQIIINDRADVAIAAGAAGVHLTTRSIPASAVRKSFGDDFVIGVSAHTESEVAEASGGGADFAVFGPVFATPGKDAPVGIGELTRVAAAAGDFPLLGLGGVDERNYREVCRASAGFAAIRFFCDAGNLANVGGFLKNGR